MSKQQRERFTERSRPIRKVVGDEVAEAPASSLRNPIVAIASAAVALTLVLGMWSFFTAEPVPATPPAPVIDGLPEGLDLEGLDLGAPPVEVIDGEEGDEVEPAEGDDSPAENVDSDEAEAVEDEDAVGDAADEEGAEPDDVAAEEDDGGEEAESSAEDPPAEDDSTSEEEDASGEDGG